MGLFDTVKGALGQVEAAAVPALINAALAKTNLGAQFDRLEEQANHLRIPVAYASMLYELRDHIDVVRERLQKQPTS